ncbi:hypothetical protein AB0I68_22875 [Streptomyces sp. NPDC050448]|uniref:hypothetical protein n=1 Tax=Streptomyces sp. NPDC050448 TaxID=3155404 RepID=UPI0034363982
MILDAALADLKGQGISEAGVERVLAALIDQGVFVPVLADGSPYFLRHNADGGPALVGCVSEAGCTEHLPDAVGGVRCDGVRLMEIARETGAGQLVLFASDGSSVGVPIPVLFGALARRGVRGDGQRMKLSWSTHPLAVALRDAAFRRLREFPDIHCVWVSHARWLDTGSEHLMVHMAVGEELPSPASQRFMQTLLTEEVTIGGDDPMVSALALHRVTHAATISDLDRFGLDTIRIDHATGRIELISREYDDPEAAEAARRALAEQRNEHRNDDRQDDRNDGPQDDRQDEQPPPRRWWRRRA